MALETHRRRTHFDPLGPHLQPGGKFSQKIASLAGPAFKASLVGGCNFMILILLGLFPPFENSPFFFIAIVIIPGFCLVCLFTGLLAGLYAEDQIEHDFQGGQVGWMAGFWAGIILAMLAMFLAAKGMLMVKVGHDLVDHFPPEQLARWAGFVTPATVALAGRVFGALLVYGLLGSLVSGLFSAVGGMIYPWLNDN